MTEEKLNAVALEMIEETEKKLKLAFIHALALKNLPMIKEIYSLFTKKPEDIPRLWAEHEALQRFQAGVDAYPRDAAIDRLRLEYIGYLQFARDQFKASFDEDLIQNLIDRTDLIENLIQAYFDLSKGDDTRQVWLKRIRKRYASNVPDSQVFQAYSGSTIPLATYNLRQAVTLKKHQRASFTGVESKRYTLRWRTAKTNYIETGKNIDFYIEAKREGVETVYLEHFDEGVLVQTYAVTVTVIE